MRLSIFSFLTAVVLGSCSSAPKEFIPGPVFHFVPERPMAGNPAGIIQGKDSIRMLYPIDQTTQLVWKISSSADQLSWTTRTSVLTGCKEVPMTNPKRILSGVLLTDPENRSGACPGRDCWFLLKTNWPCTNDPTAIFSPLLLSGDQGDTWVKTMERISTDLELGRVKDPKIFYYEMTNKWILVATTDQRVHFFESPDLRSWNHTGMFGPAGNSDLQWENPELFKVPVEQEKGMYRWVLSVTSGHPFGKGYAAVQYFIGHFDGKKFTPDPGLESVNLLDHGRDFNAALRIQSDKNMALSDYPLIAGKIGNNLYGDDLPDKRLHGMISIPRRLSIQKSENVYTLIQLPFKRLEAPGLKMINRVEDLSGILHAEINMRILITGKEKTGIHLLKTAEQQLEIGYDPVNKSVYIDRSKCGFTGFYPDFETIDRYRLQPDIKELKLTIFIDRNIVEVFIENGKAVMTSLIFPKDLYGKAEWFGPSANHFISARILN